MYKSAYIGHLRDRNPFSPQGTKTFPSSLYPLMHVSTTLRAYTTEERDVTISELSS